MQKLKVEHVCQNGLKAPVDSWTSTRILKKYTARKALLYFFFAPQSLIARLFLLKNINLVKPSPDGKMIKLLTFLAKTR